VNHLPVLEHYLFNLMVVLSVVFGSIGFLFLWLTGHDLIETHAGKQHAEVLLLVYHLLAISCVVAACITGFQVLWK
jgi:hypothetical protein